MDDNQSLRLKLDLLDFVLKGDFFVQFFNFTRTDFFSLEKNSQICIQSKITSKDLSKEL